MSDTLELAKIALQGNYGQRRNLEDFIVLELSDANFLSFIKNGAFELRYVVYPEEINYFPTSFFLSKKPFQFLYHNKSVTKKAYLNKVELYSDLESCRLYFSDIEPSEEKEIEIPRLPTKEPRIVFKWQKDPDFHKWHEWENVLRHYNKSAKFPKNRREQLEKDCAKEQNAEIKKDEKSLHQKILNTRITMKQFISFHNSGVLTLVYYNSMQDFKNFAADISMNQFFTTFYIGSNRVDTKAFITDCQQTDNSDFIAITFSKNPPLTSKIPLSSGIYTI